MAANQENQNFTGVDWSVKSAILKCQSMQVEELLPLFNPPVRKEKKKSTSMNIPLKKQRGKKICELYHQFPILSQNALCRSYQINNERKEAWESIARKINTEFQDLGVIRIHEAKKLVDYYKGRYPPVRQPSPMPQSPPSPVHPDIEKYCRELTQSVPPEYSSEEYEKYLENGRKERLEFIIDISTKYMRGAGLQNKTRSRDSEINGERRRMWQYLTRAINWVYERWCLDNLNECQVKKAFSNWKRRNPEHYHHLLSLPATPSIDASPSSSQSCSSNSDHSASSSPSNSAPDSSPETVKIQNQLQMENLQLRGSLEDCQKELLFYKNYYYSHQSQ